MLHEFDKGKAREIALDKLDLHKKLEALKKWFHRVSTLQKSNLSKVLDEALSTMADNMDESETKDFLRRYQPL